VFDFGVAMFFLSYIMIVVTVVLNLVLAVLIDEFLKAQDQEARACELQTQPDDRSARGFGGCFLYLEIRHVSSLTKPKVQSARVF